MLHYCVDEIEIIVRHLQLGSPSAPLSRRHCWRSPAFPRCLCHARSTLPHRLRTDCAITNLNLFHLDQVDNPNCVHCSSSKMLDDLLMQCSAYFVPRWCLLSTSSVIGVSSPDTRSVLFPRTSIANGIIIHKALFTFHDASTLLDACDHSSSAIPGALRYSLGLLGSLHNFLFFLCLFYLLLTHPLFFFI